VTVLPDSVRHRLSHFYLAGTVFIEGVIGGNGAARAQDLINVIATNHSQISLKPVRNAGLWSVTKRRTEHILYPALRILYSMGDMEAT
jgi:hypothetical protein